MEPRSFLLPTTAALSLAVTSACGPAIVGEWDLASTTYAGTTYTFPYTYQGTYDGTTYDVLVTGLLTIEKDLTGTISQTYSVSVDGGEPDVDETSYAAVATKVSGKEYGIVIAEQELDLSCTIDGKELTCNSNGEDDQTVVFEKSKG